MSEFATIPVKATHELAVVYRFRDAFHTPTTAAPAIRLPLKVTISLPSGPWTAFYADRDATYRFRTRLGEVPIGTFPVTVESLDGKYTNFEPFDVTLPVTLAGPHPLASDFLMIRELWPTSRFRITDGETAVYGRITHPTLPVADLKLKVYKGASPPATPYTRSNANGEFLFRLPKLPGLGGTDTVNIQVEDGAVSVTPSTFTVKLGIAQIVSFTRT